MDRAGVLVIAVVLFACPVFGQQEGREERRGPMPQFLFYEAVNMISSDSTKARVDVFYRIDAGFFVPVRNSDTTFHWAFKRRGEILVELIDSLGTSQARDINRIEIGANSSEVNLDPKQWCQGAASFSVPPGPYKIVLDVDDLESERRYLNKDGSTRANRFSAAHFEASSPLFVYWSDSASVSEGITAQNFGGNLLFGRKSALFFQLPSASGEDSSLHVEYTFSTSKSRMRDPEPVLTDTARNVLVLRNANAVIKNWGDSVGYAVTSSPDASGSAVIVPLLSDQLPLRPYDLQVKIRRGSQETQISKSLQMVWPDMPMSLRDVDYALDALRFITRESQLDSLKKGSIEARRDALEVFWKEKDKTSETAFNEIMAEYYRRVDYARKSFGTLRDDDGLKSDRGRIYVLYGPPSKVDRALDPAAGFRETWSYEKLNKKFVFADKTKSGAYVLVSTQNL